MVRFGNDDFGRLAHLPDLEMLTVHSDTIDAGVLAYFNTCPRLRLIQLLKPCIPSSRLAELRELPALSELTIHGDCVDDEWQFLASLPQLRVLNVKGPSVPAIEQLGHYLQLRTVSFDSPEIVDEIVVERLQSMNSRLRVRVGGQNSLQVVGQDPVRNSARRLAEAGVQFRGRSSDDNSFLESDEYFEIQYIDIPSSLALNNSDETELVEFAHYLYEFRADGLKNADQFVAALSSRVGVNSLVLRHSDLTDAGLATIDRVSIIDITGTEVTEAGIEAFKRRVPTCVVYSDFGTFDYEHRLPAGWDEPAAEPQPVTDATDPYARDRAAAEWVLSVGGNVGLHDADSSFYLGIFSDAALLPEDRFVCSLIHLTNARQTSSDDLERLCRLPGLQSLWIDSGQFDSEALAHCCEIPALSTLFVGYSRMRTSDVGRLSDSSELTRLSISAEQLNDDWDFLHQLPQVRWLQVSGQPCPDLKKLGDYTQLRVLQIEDADVDPGVVAQLQALNPHLRVVVGAAGAVRMLGEDPLEEVAHSWFVRGAQLEGFAFLPFSVVEIPSGPWDPQNAFFIGKMTLNPESVADNEFLQQLGEYAPHLNVFKAIGLQQADQCAATISRLSVLNRIDMTGSDLTDAGLMELSQMTGPLVLNVTGTQVTREGIDAFRRRVPTSRVESDFGTFEYEHRLPEEWDAAPTEIGAAWPWPDDAPPPAIAPFTADEATAHQQAWADYLGVPVEYENSIGMKFRLIPPGEFEMGLNAELQELDPNHGRNNWALPRRHVTITQPYYLGVHEVTHGLFKQFVDETGYETTAETNGIGGAVVNLTPSTDWISDQSRLLYAGRRTSRLANVVARRDRLLRMAQRERRERILASHRGTMGVCLFGWYVDRSCGQREHSRGDRTVRPDPA